MIKIATVFSGVGTPEWALRKMGLDYKAVFMCDIDKYARQTYLANHDVDHVFEDVTTLDGTKFHCSIDLFVGGSPCQSFSIAGKRGGFDDTRGTLFYEYARLVKEIQPKVFIWENVKGVLSHDKGMTWKVICNTFIDLGYHAAWMVLNTKEYGIPQNRERVYVVGFRDKADYDNFEFPKPFPLKLRLEDVLESGVDEKYYLSDKAINSMLKNTNLQKCKVNPDVSSALQSPGNACGIYKGCSFVDGEVITHYGHKDKPPQSHNERTTLKAESHGHEPMIIDASHKNEGLRYYEDACLTLNSRDYKEPRTVTDPYLMEPTHKHGEGGEYRDGIAPTVQARYGTGGDNVPYVVSHDSVMQLSKTRIRRLTPGECFRLQGFIDWDSDGNIIDEFKLVCSDTQCYKQAGNGMSVNVLVRLFENIYLSKPDQLKLF